MPPLNKDLSTGTLDFYRASICEGGLGSRNSVRLSVRPSVRLSVTRVDCDKTKCCTADILILHERAIICYSDTNSGWWAARSLPSKICAQSDPPPFEKCRLRQISAYNVSTVKIAKKSSIMTNIKSTTGFQTSYRWSAYVTSKSRKGGSKSDFFVF